MLRYRLPLRGLRDSVPCRLPPPSLNVRGLLTCCLDLCAQWSPVWTGMLAACPCIRLNARCGLLQQCNWRCGGFNFLGAGDLAPFRLLPSSSKTKTKLRLFALGSSLLSFRGLALCAVHILEVSHILAVRLSRFIPLFRERLTPLPSLALQDIWAPQGGPLHVGAVSTRHHSPTVKTGNRRFWQD